MKDYKDSTNLMKMGVKSSLFLITLAIIMTSCVYKDDLMLKEIRNSVNRGDDVIVLSDFTDFEWTDVVLAGPGASTKDYKEIFGSDNPLLTPYGFDITDTLVFRNAHKVVAIISRVHNPDESPPVRFEDFTKGYIVVNKYDAVFLVEEVENNVYLNLVGENE